MNTTVLGLFIVVVLLLWLLLYRVEYFSEYDGKINDPMPIVYTRCVGQGLAEDRATTAPFYVKAIDDIPFKGAAFSKFFTRVGNALYNEIERLGDVRVASILIQTSLDLSQKVYLLFPEFNKNGVKEESYALIAKNHRWYYLLLYTSFYNAGIKIPCQIRSPLIPLVKYKSFYTYYVPGTNHFKRITPFPNISYMSQFDAMKYGCDTQLVSENRKYIMLLNFITKTFGIYKILMGNPFLQCQGGLYTTNTALCSIPLSWSNYASFKIEENYIALIDNAKLLFSITISTPNTPIVLKLSNQGTIEIYDSKNAFVRTVTCTDIKNAIRGIKVDSINVNLEAIQKNLAEQQRLQEEANVRARNQQKLDEQYVCREATAGYNKSVCPIGS